MDLDILYRLIGERIRCARERAGLSQAKLADKLHMSRTSVVNVEAGRQRLPLHVLWRIAEEVGTEAALLIPQQSEYHRETQPISLNTEIIEEIEKAASGDPATRRVLTNFIEKVKARNKGVE
ncbi:helix-turn-helix domain-containing protein [Calothrix sp. NIES-2098]|uniref:helix-turn-helix domain-containing protein n=1 Tax=Calothrix sp. NIES-2098 TaxID=1954171 RepID=UPI000B61B77F|nr:hypothetical protein NIES2098_13240 [Calothrix sp. NIES-2098]